MFASTLLVGAAVQGPDADLHAAPVKEQVFDDSRWHSLGSFPGVDGVVFCIAADTKRGFIYVWREI